MASSHSSQIGQRTLKSDSEAVAFTLCDTSFIL